MTGAVVWDGVRFAYPDGPEVLRGIDERIAEGDVVVVAGSSGSGKSTLLRAAAGLVPHTSGGRFTGDVVVAGRSTRDHRPRELVDVVGFVHQDPEAQFVVDRVESDIAFSLENLGTDPVAMRRRVEEVLDALGIAGLRDRSPSTLSGGERQRVAIAGALATAPPVLVLDEPTSQLDPQGADDVLAAVARLNADLGTTVLLAEHRLERAAPMADRALIIELGAIAAAGDPGAVLAGYAGAPPVAHLGRLLGWDPPPLTVRQARAYAASGVPPLRLPVAASAVPAASATDTLVAAEDLTVALGGRPVLHDVSVAVSRGVVVALLGRNGSGKTTLLRALAHLVKAARGRVTGSGTVAYVPQDPNSLLFATSVRAEVAETLKLLGRRDNGAVDEWLGRLGIDHLTERHPRTLSAGERQRVAIAAVAVGAPDVLLLDEPTRGIDAASRTALEGAMRAHAGAGGAVVLATHDIELAARTADRVIVLGDGDVVADGDARVVLAGSLFAPQVLRVLPPFVTVEEVASALAAAASESGR